VHELYDSNGLPVPGTLFSLNCGGYGALVDGNGVLWSASMTTNTNFLLRYDPATSSGSCIYLGRSSYGLGIDSNGYIWHSNYAWNSVMKIHPSGGPISGPYITGGGTGDRGVAVTPADNDVWVANSSGQDVSRLDNNGLLKAVISVGIMPTGVAVDAAGKVWVTNTNSNDVRRIDPASNSVDLIVYLGGGAYPYNYSDMTGSTLTAPPDVGTWTVVHDSLEVGQEWGYLSWDSDEPSDGVLAVTAASSTDGVTFGPAETVTNGVDLTVADGQYLKISVQFTRSSGGFSPVLYDLTVEAANQPPVALCQDVEVEAGEGCQACATIDDGSYDPDGEEDIASLTEDPSCPYDLGNTTVTLTIEDLSGATDMCTGTVSVVDTTPPVIACNSPATITPPDVPLSFVATVDDLCGSDVLIVGYDCWAVNGAGKLISKLDGCEVVTAGASITIHESGGVGTHIDWFVEATDPSGNTSTAKCSVEVMKPGKGPK
jgi:streptogramin lyase